MAIEFEEKSKFNWQGALLIIVLALVIVTSAYFLFFAPVPVIDVIVSPEIESTSEFSNITLDPLGVYNSPEFRALRRYAGQPSTGQLGRENPFIKY